MIFARIYNNRIKFYKVETTEDKKLSDKFLSDEDGVPTIFLFKDGVYQKMKDPEKPSDEYWYTQKHLNDYFKELAAL